jgi:hypothetical protein
MYTPSHPTPYFSKVSNSYTITKRQQLNLQPLRSRLSQKYLPALSLLTLSLAFRWLMFKYLMTTYLFTFRV